MRSKSVSAGVVDERELVIEEMCSVAAETPRVCARFGRHHHQTRGVPAVSGAAFAGHIRASIDDIHAGLPGTALTLLLRKARYFRPLVCVLAEGLLPQLSQIKTGRQQGKKNNQDFFSNLGLQPHAG